MSSTSLDHKVRQSVSITFAIAASKCVILSGHNFYSLLNMRKGFLMNLVDYILAATTFQQQAINRMRLLIKIRVTEIRSVFVSVW